MAAMCCKASIFISEKVVNKLSLWVGLAKNSNRVSSIALAEAELVLFIS